MFRFVSSALRVERFGFRGQNTHVLKFVVSVAFLALNWRRLPLQQSQRVRQLAPIEPALGFPIQSIDFTPIYHNNLYLIH